MAAGFRDTRYLPDIDGLRAVAVLLVIVYHFHHAFAPSGFIGVDVFFIISGYVVTTSSNRKHHDEKGRAAISFWKRRLVRLYPALGACILFTVLMCGLFLPPFPPVHFIGQVRTGIYAMFGLANLYLLRLGSNYFEADQSGNPFLHMWSLGVEEQFYFLFATCIILLPNFVSHGRLRARTQFITLCVGTAASLGIWLFMPPPQLYEAYYLPQYRLWELGLGCILAMIVQRGYLRVSPRVSAASGVVGLAIILIANWLPPGDSYLAIMLACIGSSLVVATVPEDPVTVPTVLNRSVMTRVGRLSYSLYLWHWPIFVFFSVTVGLASPFAGAVSLCLVLLMSVISYEWIEQKFRDEKVPFLRRTVPFLVIVTLGILGLAVLIQTRAGVLYLGKHYAWNSTWEPELMHPYAGTSITAARCAQANFAISGNVPTACIAPARGAGKREARLLAIGDSMSYADWGMFDDGYIHGLFRWEALGHDGCAIGTSPALESRACHLYWSAIPGVIRSALRSGDVLFVASIHPERREGIDRSALSRYAAVIAAAEDVGARVIVQTRLPSFGRPAFLCSKEWFRANYEGCSISRGEFEKTRAPIVSSLTKIAHAHRDVVIWDPSPELCPKKTCYEFRDGMPLYKDTHHLSYWSARQLGGAFSQFFSNIAVR